MYELLGRCCYVYFFSGYIWLYMGTLFLILLALSGAIFSRFKKSLMSNNCCSQIKSIGCFGHCENIDTGLLAVQDGIHTVNVYIWNSVIVQELILSVGDPIVIPNRYNEVAQHNIQIINPDNSIYTDMDGNDCFRFTNHLKYDA